MIHRSLFVLFVLIVASSAGLAHGGNLKSQDRELPRMNWETKKLEADVLIGTSSSFDASFVFEDGPQFDENLDLNVWITPGLRSYVRGSLRNEVVADEVTPQTVDFVASFPLNAKPRRYLGIALLRDGRRPIGRPLLIEVSVGKPERGEIPIGAATPSVDRIKSDVNAGAKYIQGELIVGIEDGASDSDLSMIVESLGGLFFGSIPDLGYYQIAFPEAESPTDLDLLAQQLEIQPVVKFVERSWVFETSRTPDPGNDPFFDRDGWDEVNFGGRNAALEYTKFPSAWEFSTGNRDLRVAVIDTGFDTAHEDLVRNICFEDDCPDPFSATRPRSHGTAVAGALGAVGNNSFGITGATWDAELMLYSCGIPITPIGEVDIDPSKLLNPFCLYSSLRDAVRARARIINLSAELYFGEVAIDPALEFGVGQLLDDFFSRPDTQDVLFVFGAGNGARASVVDVYPAKFSLDYINVISVAAIDVVPGTFTPVPTPRLTRGPATVGAPSAVFTTSPGDAYTKAEGSSYSAPLVAGLAALLLSYDDTLTAAQLRQLIVNGSRDIGPNGRPRGTQVGSEPFFVINAGRSLELLVNPSPPPPSGPMVTFVLFNEGNPGVPGDGRVLDAPSVIPVARFSPGGPFIEAYELPMPIRLADMDEGITATFFRRPDVFAYIYFRVERPSFGDTCVMGFLDTPFAFPLVNGVEGVAGRLRRSSFEGPGGSIESGIQSGFCPNNTRLIDLVVTHISIVNGSPMHEDFGFGYSSFPIDAVAVGMGLDAFPDASTPSPR